jgi:transposase-like protein
MPRPKKLKADMPKKESAQQLIKTVRQRTRKLYSAEDKIRVVLEGLRGDQTVAALCRKENIHANVYYTWMKEFMEAGKARLKGEETRGATRGEVSKLAQENGELRQTVADLLLEVRALKKSLF